MTSEPSLRPPSPFRSARLYFNMYKVIMPEVLDIPIVQGGKPFRETLELDGEEFIFDFSWNQRDQAWYLYIFKNGIAMGPHLRLIAGYNLLDALLSLDKPSGFLYLYDVDLNTSVGNEADIDSLGNRILLVYESPEEAA